MKLSYQKVAKSRLEGQRKDMHQHGYLKSDYSYLADAFIESGLQVIRLSTGQSPLEQCEDKGLAQGPNSCTDLVVATLGIEPTTFQGTVKQLNQWAIGSPSTRLLLLLVVPAQVHAYVVGREFQASSRHLDLQVRHA